MQRTPIDVGQAAGALSPDPAAVHAQLAKVLNSAHFRNSKRSQSLLKFVVDAAIAGDVNSLKERCLGAAVFGRDIAYDTSHDPIVRNAAIEVRKRLAQYYMELEHGAELRIELPIGSYLPSFAAEMPAVEPAPVVSPRELAEPVRPRVSRRALKWVMAVGAVVLLASLAVLLWNARRTPTSELEAFWEPLFRDQKAVQICIGQPTRLYRFTGPRTEELNRVLGGPPAEREPAKLSVDSSELTWVAPEYLFSRDALSAFNVAAWIQARGRAYQLMSVSQTNYSRLRHVPLVAIGAYNNPWSMRVTAELRFVFDHGAAAGVTYNCIKDRRAANGADWRAQQAAGGPVTEDYAVVTRVFDPATEKTVISAAGIDTFGTLAASEFVTQPDYLGAALQAAPSSWRRKNVQFVLGTKIIDGTPGPPRVLASHYW